MRREKTEIEREIIGCLAREGAMLGYQVSEKTGLPKSSTYKFLGELESKGLVSSKRLRKSVRKRKNTKGETEYSLTLLGILKTLPFFRREEWQTIIERWSELAPDVFGKWDFFVSAGVGNLAMRKLKWAAAARITETSMIPHILPYEFAMTQLMVLDFFYTNFYHPEVGLHNDEARERWAKACGAEKVVRRRFMKILGNNLIRHYTGIVDTKKMLLVLQKNDKIIETTKTLRDREKAQHEIEEKEFDTKAEAHRNADINLLLSSIIRFFGDSDPSPS